MKTKSRLHLLAAMAFSVSVTLTSHAANTTPPVDPFPAVAIAEHINVRGQATTRSEILGQITRGDVVTVVDAITVSKPKEGDPTNWFKIVLPSSIPVWVHSSYVDSNQMTVTTRKLNLRAGPGESFSIMGRIEQGTPVKEIRRMDDWLQIEPTTNSFGYVCSDFILKKEASPPPAIPVEPAAPVEKPAPVVPAPVAPPPPEPAPAVTPAPAVIPAPAPAPAIPVVVPSETVVPPEPVVEPVKKDAAKETAAAKSKKGKKTTSGKTTDPVDSEPLPKRVVTREGIVRHTINLNSPSWFELEAKDTQKIINYLFTTDTNITLKALKDKVVTVTGEEGLDKRWPNTPVIVIHKIQVIE